METTSAFGMRGPDGVSMSGKAGRRVGRKSERRVRRRTSERRRRKMWFVERTSGQVVRMVGLRGEEKEVKVSATSDIGRERRRLGWKIGRIGIVGNSGEVGSEKEEQDIFVLKENKGGG